jgi:hypothetical protein
MEPLAVNVKKETFFHPVKVKPIYGFKPFFMFLSPTSNGVAVYEVVPLEGK